MIHCQQPKGLTITNLYITLLTMLLCSIFGCDDGESTTEEMAADAMVTPTRDLSVINRPDVENTDTDTDMPDTYPTDVENSDMAVAESDSAVNMVDADTVLPDVGPLPTECTVRIELNIPEETDSTTPIYIAGDFCQNSCETDGSDCCDWTANDPQFAEIAAERTETQAYFEFRVPAFVDFEYKFTQGDWSRVEMNRACEDVPNRSLRAACPTGDLYRFTNTVSAWADVCR